MEILTDVLAAAHTVSVAIYALVMEISIGATAGQKFDLIHS